MPGSPARSQAATIIGRVSGIGIITGGSILSRVATFVLLVFAARTLELRDFGLYALITGVTIGIANTIAVGIGDMIASSAVRDLSQVKRTNSTIAAAVTTSCILFLVALAVGWNLEWLITLASVMLLFVTTTVSMFEMQVLRGVKGGNHAALFGYYLPAFARFLIVLVIAGDTPLKLLLVATAAASAIPALSAAVYTYHAVATSRIPQRSDRSAGGNVSISSALAIGCTWLVLNQADVAVLSIYLGAEATGSFTPTMRIFEALTAFAIAAKFSSTRSTFSPSSEGAAAASPIRITLLLYLPACIVLVLFGDRITYYILGESQLWSPELAVLLAVTYLFASVASVLIQYQIGLRRWRYVGCASIATIASMAVLMPVLVTSFGFIGAVSADAIVFGIWAMLLKSGVVIWKRKELAT